MASEVVLSLPHKLRVMRMYRTGLKELINWSATRHEWYPRAHALRAEFEENKDMTDRQEIRKAVEHGEELLARFRHWEPIIKPDFVGGTAYSVNPAQPKLKFIPNYDYMEEYKKGDHL